VNVNEQVNTLGRLSIVLKQMCGSASGNPSGGTSEHLVRKLKTSFKVGDPWGLSVKNMSMKMSNCITLSET